jgi:Na+/H+-dicarboxylate symporter
MSQATRILLALAVGLALGIAAAAASPELAAGAANVADPVGNLWLNGLRMTIVPLLVALLVTGIAQTAEAAKAGKIAARTLAWIIALMTLSALAGAILTPLFLSIAPMPEASAAALRNALTTTSPVGEVPPFADFLRSIIPTNPIAAAASDAILPLIIFTGVFAFAVTRLPLESRTTLTSFFSALADAMIIVIEWVLKLAPIGVFALAFVVGARSGAAAFGAVLHYIVLIASVGLVVSVFAYPLAVLGGRVPLGRFARTIAPVQALAISTQSSLACLPIMLKKSEALGVPERTAGIVLPLAVALLRATGPAMNLAVALYVANWFGVELGPAQYAVAILAAVLTSMGSVSLPGQVSFVTAIAPICLLLGAPVEALALLIAVEVLPDIVRTLGNVMMDVAVTTTVSRQAGETQETCRKPCGVTASAEAAPYPIPRVNQPNGEASGTWKPVTASQKTRPPPSAIQPGLAARHFALPPRIAPNGTNEVRDCQPRQLSPSAASFFRSCPIEPNKARIRMPRAMMRLRGLPQTERWTRAQRMKLQFIGCRVIAKTPVAGREACFSAPGWGKAGLRTNEPTRRMLARSMIADAAAHHQPGAIHIGTASAPG